MSDPRQRIYVAFDTETTGLLPDRAHVVEIAGVRFAGNGDEISRFSTLANPGEAIGREVTDIHGINDAMVARAPKSADACRLFVNWIGPDDVLIAHHAAFDVAFIASELKRGGYASPANAVIDTLKCMRWWLAPENGRADERPRDFKLKTLVEYFGLQETTYHRAMADSLHVMALFRLFLEHAPRVNFDDLQRVAGVPSHRDVAAGRAQGHPRFFHLSDIIDRGEILSMRYDGGPKAGSQRRILPIKFDVVGGCDVLVAQCLSSGSVEHFHIDRVIDLAPIARERRT